MRDFEMPGTVIPGFGHKAAAIAKVGIYSIRVHRDEAQMPILKHRRIFELSGLDVDAQQARERLREHLDRLEIQARPFEARMARGA